MMWEAFGGLVLVLAAFGAALWIAYRKGDANGYQRHGDDMAERRAQIRAERRAQAAVRGHQLAPFPDGDWAERLADTGELRLAAETGDLAEIERQNAAFFRVFALATEWTRKRETA